YVADASGRVTRRREIDVAGACFLHDFAITERHAIFFDTPARMIRDWGVAPGLPFAWSDTHAPRAAVVPREGGEVRWFDVEPCHFGHTVNAFEEGGRIVVDAVRYDCMDGALPSLRRWELDLGSGRARSTRRRSRASASRAGSRSASTGAGSRLLRRARRIPP